MNLLLQCRETKLSIIEKVCFVKMVCGKPSCQTNQSLNSLIPINKKHTLYAVYSFKAC